MLMWMSGFLDQQGRPKEAEQFVQRAQELYPGHPSLMRDWPALPLQ
jgi:hypothetical protein